MVVKEIQRFKQNGKTHSSESLLASCNDPVQPYAYTTSNEMKRENDEIVIKTINMSYE